jgi:hypothetical protein
MKKYIVITSIYEPTEAIYSFSNKTDYQLVVVGDKKTPVDWSCDNAIYLNLENQAKIGLHLHKVLPVNHYCRKMMGYLYSITQNADSIVDTDDDNIPNEDWEFPDYEGAYFAVDEDVGFVNIYQLYTDERVWPRGLPIRCITKDFELKKRLSEKNCKVGVWQGLADEDPDVDAIYRLTKDDPVFFDKRGSVVLGRGTISPFNTQNTIIIKDLFPLMYLPTYVTFRFTDILRGLIAQPIMWLYDFQLGFTNATVVQKRNQHDYFEDFLSEVPMYEYSEKVLELTDKVIHANNTMQDNLFNAYEELNRHNIVESKELITLDAWFKDLDHINNKDN